MLTNCAVDKVSGQDRLLVVWFGEVKTCIWIFNYMGVSTLNPALFKGPLYNQF